jgi:hypothetical protein
VALFFHTALANAWLNANLQVFNADPALKDITWVSIRATRTQILLAAPRYADRFKADPKRWLFCRGDLDYVKRVAKGMDLYLSLKGHQTLRLSSTRREKGGDV